MDDSPNNKSELRPYLRKNCNHGLLALSHETSAKEIPELVHRSSSFGQRNLLAALPYRAWVQRNTIPRLDRMLGARTHPRLLHDGRQPSGRRATSTNVRRALRGGCFGAGEEKTPIATLESEKASEAG
jgi:hypothetical protein